MAILKLNIQNVSFNDVTGELVLNMIADYDPTIPLPPGAREDLAIIQESTVKLGPIKLLKGNVTPVTCVYVNPVDRSRWTCTWTGTAWSAPFPVPVPRLG